MAVSQKKKDILAILEKTYEDRGTALNYDSEYELLVAVILSAQCTDVRVNIVTERLFKDYNTPEKILSLGQDKLEEYIKSCGLFHSKAKNILASSEIICRDYNGEVPQNFDDLIKLPGVGRKTANVVMSNLFNTPAIAVDTHVFRVANRLELAKGKTPLEVEKGLMKVIPKDKWSSAHHWLIWHGRNVCKAQRPLCASCEIKDLCKSAKV